MFSSSTYTTTTSSRVSGHTDQARVVGNAHATITVNGGANAPIASQSLDRIFEDAINDWLPNAGVLGHTIEAAGNERAVVTANGARDAPITSRGLDWIFADVFDDLLPNADVNVGNPEVTNTRAFGPTFGSLGGVPETYHPMNADFVNAWLAPTPPLTESDTPALTPSDAAWEGHVFPPAQLITEPQGNPLRCSSATSARPSQTELAGQYDQGQFYVPTPLYADGNGGVINPYFNFWNNAGNMPWGSAGVSTAFDVADIGHGVGNMLSHTGHILGSERTSLGKRPRSEETIGYGPEGLGGDNRPRPSKKVKGKTVVRGVLEAVGSTSSGPLKSATKTPINISVRSVAAGRGAGRLAAPYAHEVYHQRLPGPRVQELAGTTARGELHRVEGSEEVIRHYTSSIVQPPVVSSNAEVGERENRETGNIRLPNKLSQRQRDLLVASSDELGRGAVHRLKCHLCPGAGFGKWEDFKRHCKDSEAHPEEISFCRYCGDFFARSDARNRHEQHRPRSCRDVTPAEAEAKRVLTKHVYDAFKDKFERCLASSEETWTPFSQMVMAVLPNTSKRGSRQQCRIKASEA